MKDGPKVDKSKLVVVQSREEAKEMARAARRVARSKGKRITMSMFIIADL